MDPLHFLRCLHWEPNDHTYQTKKKKVPQQQSSNPLLLCDNLHGQDKQLLNLKRQPKEGDSKASFPFPHSHVAAAHFSPLSFPCKGTGLVWQKLTATVGCVTLSHCHTSLQNEYLHPPHRHDGSARFLGVCKHGSAHSSDLDPYAGIGESVDFNVDLWTDEEAVRKHPKWVDETLNSWKIQKKRQKINCHLF